MANLKTTLRLAPVFGLTALALAGCGGGDGDKVVQMPTPPAPQRFEDMFGANFGVAFRADRNTDPRDAQAGDVVAPSLTTDPRDIT